MKTGKALVSQQGLSSLQRPRFSAGLLLEDEDLTAGVDYTRDLSRLLFSSLFGCGVVCGLDVEAVLTCNRSKVAVTVKRGIALDCRGNPIHVPKDQALTYDPDCKPLPPTIWVTVCYVEKCCRPRDVSCLPDDDSQIVQTRSRDAFEIRLDDAQPGCACSCEAPAPKKPDRPKGECCPDPESRTEDESKVGDKGKTADPCACYQEHNCGVCSGDCGCTCVVVARIDIKDSFKNADESGDRNKGQEKRNDVAGMRQTDLKLIINRDMVRWIRPVLTGYKRCLEREKARHVSGDDIERDGQTHPVSA